MVRITMALAIAALACGAAGCQLGPTALRIGHAAYGDAVRKINDEQMLLNLVRLRYRDTPVWLEVTSISTQFAFDSSGELSGTLKENVGQGGSKNPNQLGLSGRVGYSERPTITYTILGGEDFLKRMLSSIDVASIALLTESGWRSDRVLRLAVERMNGLKNAPLASGPTPAQSPRFKKFLAAVRLMQELAGDQRVEFEYEDRVQTIGSPLKLEKISGGDVLAAAKLGTEFRSVAPANMVALAKHERTLSMRFTLRAADSGDAERLRDLLHLDPTRTAYDLRDMLAGDYDPTQLGERLSDISLDTRSVLGVLYYLCNAVQVPPEDIAAGRVTDTVDKQGHPFDWGSLLDDIFIVHHSSSRPVGAAVAVRYRGSWFYIADNDQSSKSTFALLHQLASLQAGDVKSAAPVLTLPVGG
ncbi:MAG: hypothetical protein ACE5E5_03945 [Phycisphaerae bacterium]